MVTIHRKPGWVLNPNDKTVNNILKMIENNDGKCPCFNISEDTHCPCTGYIKEDKCCCGLYLKVED
jgi:ferredoxin-thioredoxin reductase catalytic subunit